MTQGKRGRRGQISQITAKLLAVTSLLVLFGQASAARDQAIETLEIEIGEPIGDAVARSTRKYDLHIPLDMQSLDIPGRDEKGGALEIVLRNGAGKTATLPWQASDGTLWMYVGITDEIDLRFAGFDDAHLREESSASIDPFEAEIAGIVEIYERVISLTLRPRERSTCYRNELTLSDRPCERVTMATSRLTRAELQQVLRQFHAAATAEDWSDRSKTAQTLNLGQWWLPNGSITMLKVIAIPPIGGWDDAAAQSPLPARLELTVNIRDFFNSRLARLSLSCHDQQAIFPEKILYTQEQAAAIFHGLYADFFPPVVDGEAVSDRIKLASLDWSQLESSYWNEPETRRNFCNLLHHLEREIGYAGPVSPRK